MSKRRRAPGHGRRRAERATTQRARTLARTWGPGNAEYDDQVRRHRLELDPDEEARAWATREIDMETWLQTRTDALRPDAEDDP